MRTRLAGLTAATVAVVSVTAAAVSFSENFSGMPTGTCIADDTTLWGWTFVYDGYGCTAFIDTGGNTTLVERPMASTSPDETHGALVVGPWTAGDLDLEVSTVTTRQLRTGSAPNPWEVGWVLWNLADTVHFYYFIPKPNGWELGKADPAYPGAQRFLATGASPRFPAGAWYRVRVVQTGATIQVLVDDRVVTTFTDEERPYSSGQVGLYSEDAEVHFDNVAVGTPVTPRGRKKVR